MSDDLSATLSTVIGRIERYGPKGINEQDTKGTLIQPVLRALGWDVEDLDDVTREYKRRPQDKPVDYALFLLRTPRLFLEAKALGHNLDDRKWANQIMGYAGVAGVEWVVLTDGNEYRIYNSHAVVPIEEKLFRIVRLTDDANRAAETLTLLSKNRIRENEIDVLWKAHFVDRQVRAVVEQLFGAEPDPSVVRLVAKRVGNLSSGDVRASLQRAEVTFNFPVNTLNQVPRNVASKPAKVQREKNGKREPRRIKQVKGLVYLRDIIEAQLLHPPVKVFRRYKGSNLEATIRADGKVIFQNTVYDSPSTAAEYARGTVTGRRMNTNGWNFWQLMDQTGRVSELDTVRKLYQKRKA